MNALPRSPPRVCASTGADVAACSLCPRLAPSRAPPARRAPPRRVAQDARRGRGGGRRRQVRSKGPARPRGERPHGPSAHRVYRAEDPRRPRSAPHGEGGRRPARAEVAEKLEEAALKELHARKPDRVHRHECGVLVRRGARLRPASRRTSSRPCSPSRARGRLVRATSSSRRREGRLIRPTAKYIGPGAGARLKRSRGAAQGCFSSQFPSSQFPVPRSSANLAASTLAARDDHADFGVLASTFFASSAATAAASAGLGHDLHAPRRGSAWPPTSFAGH